jgi:hypothetical protein
MGFIQDQRAPAGGKLAAHQVEQVRLGAALLGDGHAHLQQDLLEHRFHAPGVGHLNVVGAVGHNHGAGGHALATARRAVEHADAGQAGVAVDELLHRHAHQVERGDGYNTSG